jgi:hypothetical protein
MRPREPGLGKQRVSNGEKNSYPKTNSYSERFSAHGGLEWMNIKNDDAASALAGGKDASSPSSTSSNIEVEDVSNLPPWVQKDRIVTAIQEMEIKNGGIAERPWREDPFYDIAEAQSEGVSNEPLRQDATPLQPGWKIGAKVTPKDKKLAAEKLMREEEPSSSPAQPSVAAVFQVPLARETGRFSQKDGTRYSQRMGAGKIIERRKMT